MQRAESVRPSVARYILEGELPIGRCQFTVGETRTRQDWVGWIEGRFPIRFPGAVRGVLVAIATVMIVIACVVDYVLYSFCWLLRSSR